MISEQNGQYLVEVAKEAISVYLETNRRIPIPEDCPDELKQDLGVFVTLNKRKRLRGCIGYPEPVKSLIESLNFSERKKYKIYRLAMMGIVYACYTFKFLNEKEKGDFRRF